MRIRPKAVILDYGNVLSGPQPGTDVGRMASILDLTVAHFEQRYWRFRLAYDEAALDPADYWRSVADGPVTEAQIEGLNRIDSASWSYPSPAVPEWARELGPAGFLVGLLSNMPVPVRDYTQTRAWLPKFDHRTYSCDVRMSKPAPRIYKIALGGLDIAPNQALFLDDRPINVRAAEALGMHAVLFTALGDVAAELERRFDIPALSVATLEESDEKDQ